MIRNIFTVLVLFICLTVSSAAFAQEFSGLDKSPADIAYFRTERNAPPLIKVTYSRPQLKGREVGVDLAAYGEVWRTGANEATEIRFYQDMVLGETTIPAGTYSLFSIPGKEEWTIIINKDTDDWGAYSYEEGQDLARLAVPASSGDESLEAFSITFEAVENGAHMHMGWGQTRVAVPFMVAQ